MIGIGAALGLGVVLTMANRLSGPAAAASASLKTLEVATDRAAVAQMRLGTITKAGMGLFIGGAGAAVAFGLVTKSAADFEEGMARVGAVLAPTTRQFQDLTSSAIEAGIKTQWSPRQATEGLKDLATAGFNAEESIKTLLPVLDLATGSLGQLGVGEAAMGAAAAVRGFGFAAKDSAKVVDILLRSTQLTNIQARDLQVMLARVAGNARAAGQEFEHTVSILGALRNTGAEASVAATTLRSALRQMIQPRSVKVMESLNVNIWDAQGNFNDLATIIFNLEHRLTKATEKERMLALMTIFGARGMNSYNAVVAMGAERFSELESQLKHSAGTAEVFRKKVLEPLKGRLVLVWGSVQTLATQLGSPLLSPLKMAVSFFYKLLNTVIALTQLFPRTTSLIVRLVAIVGFLSMMAGGILLLTSALWALQIRYALITKAKYAYLIMSKLIFGMDGLRRTQILGLAIAEQLHLTVTDITNMKMKVRIILEKILGIGISRRTSVTYAAVSAAWAERISTIGNNAVLLAQNIIRRIGTMLTWRGIKANIASARAMVGSSLAMRGAAGASGILMGSIKGLFAVMAAHPILLLIGIIVIAAVVFYKLAKAFWNAKGAAQAFYGLLIYAMSPMLAPIIFFAKMFSVAWKQNIGGVKTAFIQMKDAIWSIFKPIGMIFSSLEGGGSAIHKLFVGLMKFVMLPLRIAFDFIAKVATILGAVITIIIQEIEAAVQPLIPAIDALGKAFDELSIAFFGPGKTNLGLWRVFGIIVRFVVRACLNPLVTIVTKAIDAITWLTNKVKNGLVPLKEFASWMAKVANFGWAIGKGALSFVFGGAVGMQHGGVTNKPTSAILSEKRNSELVMPLPTGLQPADLKMVFDKIKAGDAGGRRSMPSKITIENRIFLDGREIKRTQKELSDLEVLRGYGFAVA